MIFHESIKVFFWSSGILEKQLIGILGQVHRYIILYFHSLAFFISEFKEKF